MKKGLLIVSMLLSLLCIGICVYYCILEWNPEWFIFRNGDVNWIEFQNRTQQVIHKDDIADIGRIAWILTGCSWIGYLLPDVIKDKFFKKEEA